MISALLSLPVAVAAYYANGTVTTSHSATSEALALPSSSQELTTYITVELGKNITVTTPKDSVPTAVAVNAAPAPASSEELTTYVTVKLGKTITVTTPKAKLTAAPQPPYPVPVQMEPASDDITTYVTVLMGRTMTITAAKPKATSINLVNGAETFGNSVKLAALAGAGVALLL